MFLFCINSNIQKQWNLLKWLSSKQKLLTNILLKGDANGERNKFGFKKHRTQFL